VHPIRNIPLPGANQLSLFVFEASNQHYYAAAAKKMVNPNSSGPKRGCDVWKEDE